MEGVGVRKGESEGIGVPVGEGMRGVGLSRCADN